MKNYSKGTTEQRPAAKYLDKGYYYWDLSLSLPIFWNGSKWINSSGNTAYLNKGNTQQRPTLTNADDGFQYYDTTLKKYIVWNGTEWTNMDGSSLG